MTPAPVTDALLGSRYRLTSLIATGGMGEVWSATDEVLGRNVAVKVLRSEYVDDPEFLERFRVEARHTAALSHPGIAAIYDYDDGETADRTLDVVAQPAFALQAAHDAGVIHRDVKPGNILLRPDGVMKITDFGISRAINSVPLTVTGAVMGTAFYLSPEQASGQSLTPASDIYSLGIVAYECLAGRRPFSAETPAAVALAQVRDEPPALGDDVRPDVAALVLRMLAKSPEDRSPSAGGLARAVQDVRAAGDEPDATTRTLAVTSMGDVAATTALRMPHQRRVPHWVPYAAGVAVLAVVLALVLRGFTDTGGGSGPSTPTPSASSPTVAPVVVRAADYLGTPEAEATATLRGLGLSVSTRRVAASPGTPIGTVTGVTPTGRLNPGDRVTLDVATAGPPGKQKQPKPPGQKKKDDRKQGKP